MRRVPRHPLVSVVVTVYNEARVVEQAIKTLLAQSYVKLELIFVDDCSTDNTLTILDRYKARRNVRVLRLKKNSGPGAGRNAGARIAKGEILVFVDADMVFDKNYVKNLIVPILNGSAIGAFHDTELVKNKNCVWARAFSINRIENPGPTSGIFRAVLRKKFLAIGGFDPKRGYFDDNLGALGVSIRAHAICYHNNPETLSEILKHSRWVGRSLLLDPGLRRRCIWLVLGFWVWLLGVCALVFAAKWSAAAVVLVCGALPVLALVIAKGVGRCCKDGYIEFLVTVPIVWLVRLLGYLLGASGEFSRQILSRK